MQSKPDALYCGARRRYGQPEARAGLLRPAAAKQKPGAAEGGQAEAVAKAAGASGGETIPAVRQGSGGLGVPYPDTATVYAKDHFSEAELAQRRGGPMLVVSEVPDARLKKAARRAKSDRQRASGAARTGWWHRHISRVAAFVHLSSESPCYSVLVGSAIIGTVMATSVHADLQLDEDFPYRRMVW